MSTVDRSSSLPTYFAPHVAAFAIDGNLGKRVWRRSKAARLSNAVAAKQRLQPTTLRACWSDTHLYVAFRCTDRVLQATYTQRDDPLYDEDVVEVFLSTGGDPERYVELEFSPKNVIFDAQVYNPRLDRSDLQVDTTWDCDGLQSAVRIQSVSSGGSETVRGWSVEIAIPFSGLGVSTPAIGEAWRANFYRIDYAAPPEFSAWSPPRVANYHLPRCFGTFRFADANSQLPESTK